ncbi:MAG: HlyD family efflux transporter periplasmic adaptor subunit [Burkholderiaceae bacterium]|nr:HlyD family efflux transporter periplasmic adaptor subunit [Burkholderiaceae bacterium]
MSLLRRIGIAALLVIAVGIAITYLNSQQLPPAPVAFASGNGRIEAIEVNIAAKQAGRIQTIQVREGDDVSVGQVVATMDTSALTADLRQARAQLDQARYTHETARATVAREQSQLALAEKQIERSKQLIQKGFLSPQKLDTDQSARDSAAAALRAAQSQLQQTGAAIDAAQARVDRIRADIQDASLVSPINGRVLYRLVQPGEVVSPGGNVLTLLDLTDVTMTIFLPTAEAGRVSLGAEARIVLDIRQDISIPATVSFVSPEAQFTPKTVETKSEREKLMFRVKIKIPESLLRAHAKQVKTGLPGVGHVQLDSNMPWPASIPPLISTRTSK